MLAQEDVGKRVVVRHLVAGATGPSGGPLQTDVIGTLERLSPEDLTVRRDRDGALISIPRELLVAAKPVPPRPSRRSRG